MGFGASDFGRFAFNQLLDTYSFMFAIDRPFLYRICAFLDSGVWNVGSSDVVRRVPHLSWGRRHKSIGPMGNVRLLETLSSSSFFSLCMYVSFLMSSSRGFPILIFFNLISLNCWSAVGPVWEYARGAVFLSNLYLGVLPPIEWSTLPFDWKSLSLPKFYLLLRGD